MKTAQAHDKRIYSVSELTRDIRFVLEGTFGSVWVEGEVSNFTRPQSGHMYFSIRDKESVLSCVLFRNVSVNLKFKIENGMKVLCFGRVSVYDKRGQYQLYVNTVEPKGAGALQVALEQLKERLRKEGLFDESRKKSIPYLPRKVGIVTSPTGAAIKDILNIAKRRFANIEIILNPVRVQGKMAKKEIADAVDLFNTLKNVDVIILGRGGGSLEDLWPFNEEAVARSVYRSKIPVISAVGHEVDWTISDFVADFRAPTPSAAAELVIPKKEDLKNILRTFSERMQIALLSKSDFLGEKLQALKNRYIFREPFDMVLQRAQQTDDLAENIYRKSTLAIKFKKEALNALAGKLEALSPLGTLKRGYSITMKYENGKILKSTSLLKQKDRIRTRLAEGEVVSRVEEVSRVIK